MKTDRIAVRLEPETKAALQDAADKDGRSISNMAAWIIGEWLAKPEAKRKAA